MNIRSCFSRIHFSLAVILLTTMFSSGQASLSEPDVHPEVTPRDLDIYLVIGQSNMAGRATIREQDKTAVENAFLFTGNRYTPWVLATNPLNRHSTVRKRIGMQRLGPAYSFARAMAGARPEHPAGLVVNARGGTKIVQWMPGTDLYEAAVKQTHEALKYGQLKGIIWHQGEGDCHPLRVELYLGRLEILINALREEFDEPAVPFVAGQLYETERRHAFNQMILELPDFIRHTGVARSEGTSVFDGTHFDSESAIILGERYADEMLKLIKDEN